MAETRKNWSDFEDKAITTLVKRYGTKNWAEISQKMSSKYGIDVRTGKQCRQRWHNHLDPSVNKQSWSEKDEQIMFQAHQKYGNKWTLIAKLFEGRTDNDIKNHFYSMLRRSLRRINKLLGKRNSTQKIKVIKPAVLSKVFAKETKDNGEVSEDGKKIAEALFELSKAKTITNLTDSIDLENKRKFEELIEKLSHYNEEYQQSQFKRRESRNSEKSRNQSLQRIGNTIQAAEGARNRIELQQRANLRRSSITSFKKIKRPQRKKRQQGQDKNLKQVETPKTRKNKAKQRSEAKNNKHQTPISKLLAPQQLKQQMMIQPQEVNRDLTGYMTRLKRKTSEQSLFAGEELNLPPDLFEIQSLHSFRKNSTNSNDSKRFSKNNSFFSFSPGFTPNNQSNPGFLNNFTSPNSAGRNWTPLCPSPNLTGIFSRIGDYQWKGNNEDLDAIVYQTRRNIEKQIQ